jgi:hypothetical protein
VEAPTAEGNRQHVVTQEGFLTRASAMLESPDERARILDHPTRALAMARRLEVVG